MTYPEPAAKQERLQLRRTGVCLASTLDQPGYVAVGAPTLIAWSQVAPQRIFRHHGES
jgi:hypothetical protein